MRALGFAAFALVALLVPTSQSAAPPITCPDACTIGATSEGYLPPVVVVTEGALVSWEAIDGTPHANTDAGLSVDPCMFVDIPGGEVSEPIAFEILDGELRVRDDLGPNETTTACANAVALPNGGFAISYFCVLHPQLMRGALVVQPA